MMINIIAQNFPTADQVIISKEQVQHKYLYALAYTVSILIASEKKKKQALLN